MGRKYAENKIDIQVKQGNIEDQKIVKTIII